MVDPVFIDHIVFVDVEEFFKFDVVAHTLKALVRALPPCWPFVCSLQACKLAAAASCPTVPHATGALCVRTVPFTDAVLWSGVPTGCATEPLEANELVHGV